MAKKPPLKREDSDTTYHVMPVGRKESKKGAKLERTARNRDLGKKVLVEKGGKKFVKQATTYGLMPTEPYKRPSPVGATFNRFKEEAQKNQEQREDTSNKGNKKPRLK